MENLKRHSPIFYVWSIKCNVTLFEKVVSLDQSDGMQLPCEIKISSKKTCINILKRQFLVYFATKKFYG